MKDYLMKNNPRQLIIKERLKILHILYKSTKDSKKKEHLNEESNRLMLEYYEITDRRRAAMMNIDTKVRN